LAHIFYSLDQWFSTFFTPKSFFSKSILQAVYKYANQPRLHSLTPAQLITQ